MAMSMSVVFLAAALCLIAGVSAQGFSPFRPSQNDAFPTRRQLSPDQQTHILSDIQQHQHRFNVHQQQPIPVTFPNNQPQSLHQQQHHQQQPQQQQQQQQFSPNSVFFNQPSQTTFSTQGPILQHHTQTQFIPNYSQQPQNFDLQSQQKQFLLPHFQNQFGQQQLHTQQVQQRSIQNQFNPQFPTQSTIQQQQPLAPTAAQPTFAPTENQQPFAHLQPTRQFNDQVHQQAAPQVQQPQFQQQQQQQQYRQQQFTQFQQQPSLPFDPKLEALRQKELEEKQKIIQKHEQFVQKQYQKQQTKVKQLHDDFLQQQERVRSQSIASKIPHNQDRSIPHITRSRGIFPSEVTLFQRAVDKYHEIHPTPAPTTTTTTTTPPPITTKRSRVPVPSDISDDDLQTLLENNQHKLFSRLAQQEAAAADHPKSSKSKSKSKGASKGLGREDLLKQLKLALADQPQPSLGNSTYSSMDLTLPNGQKVQVIRTTDPNLVQGATPINGDASSILAQATAGAASSDAGSPISLADLAKSGAIPAGADFEVVKQGSDGALEKVGELPKEKKVTYVYLEEQNDGSFKVQGVKGNGDKDVKTSGTEVDGILKRIKEGDIKLPTTPQADETSKTVIPLTKTTESVTPASIQYSSPYLTTLGSHSTLHTASSSNVVSSTLSPSTYHPSSVTPQTPEAERLVATTVEEVSSTASPVPLNHHQEHQDTAYAVDGNQEDLITTLKNNGLHAMAKYLRQSGLDSILNETGPYTVFAPSDKAFKGLLVQLGGPDRAEEKFKSNPRLLSGLLLHHVIPGSFKIESLQDEMTGVSLAGTQLRVNQYNMHDQEWNDVKTTTINGAMIQTEKQDIPIPQGIAHAVDRVMFPLPVGDILQTLQSDRERRFTHFLRAIYMSGLLDLLQSKGPKTYTVFAPTDSAFATLAEEEQNRIINDKQAAHELVSRHIIPGTLYSAGMRYYQVRESLTSGSPLTLQKTSGGKIKVNETQMVTSNIPATNGVIHAIDSLL